MLDDTQRAEADRQLAHRADERIADLERQLAAVQHARRSAEKVCADALTKRNQAEADRNKARAALRRYQRLYELVRDENARLRIASPSAS